MSTLASFQNQVKPNWCPGCGDYAVQMALQQAAVKLNLEPHQLALVSGIRRLSIRLRHAYNSWPRSAFCPGR
jgi:pyruvate/2-oxoacid:ferredoxin oxidoreductase beta subunit